MWAERQLIPCARAGDTEGSVTESAVLMWHMADASLHGPQGSPSGNSNQLTVASQVICLYWISCQQVTNAAAAMPGWCVHIVGCLLLGMQRRSARTVVAEGDLRSHQSVENYSSPGGTKWTRGPLPWLPPLRAIEQLNAAAATDNNTSDRLCTDRDPHLSNNLSKTGVRN